MKRKTILLVIALFAVVWIGYTVIRQKVNVQSNFHPQEIFPSQNEPFQLASSAFSHYQPIPEKYTCDGENISPPLTISGAPKGTQSFLLITEDPDSPSGEFIHWVVANIVPDTREIFEGTIPPMAASGRTGFGKEQYGGPCPPAGTHRYFFTIYALDIKLGLIGKTKKDLMESINGHSLAKATLIGTYTRK